MKLAIIGYGAMGQLVAKLAAEQGHEISVTLRSRDAERSTEELAGLLRGCDVAIDFSVAAVVIRNVKACASAELPLVEGTTGWQSRLDEVKNVVSQNDGALIYGANFSVGVQVFYRIAASAAELFHSLESYDAFIEEAHHKRKRDAPSGTALQLGEIVALHVGREVPVSSTRAGYIPGTHRVGFDSPSDQIILEHIARGREGFAAGALLAANWIVGRKGVYEFSEVFDEIIKA
ncbi:MAG: dihydrodipicolinate reductase [Acidobacteria bacterium]|nr:MAG: dihydrodipicolinate reductase [Acidobacteriota bacterium]